MPSSLPSVPAWLPLWQLLVVGVALASLLVVRRVSTGPRLGDHLRRRLLLGVPWGTLLTVVFVVAVYLFVQNGVEGLTRPLVIPFVAWSYYYPLGIVASPFTHGGLGHLTGNVIATLVLAPIAEYAWSHFPTERGSHSFSSLRTNPFVRILAVPVGSVLVGLLTAVFSLGPVIGFSGVVFAYAGFAVVRYPLATLLVLIGQRVLSLLLQTLQNPTVTASGGTGYSLPWWANVAIHGHFYGFVFGAVVALAFLVRREYQPRPGRVFFGVLGFATFQALWAIYVPLSGNRFLLLRALGTTVVFALAALVATAAVASDRPLVPRIGLNRREAAFGLVVGIVVVLSLITVPVNATTVADHDVGSDAVEVRDYTVTYVEDEPNRFVSALPVPVYNLSNSFNTSGVVVTSERRHIWYRAVSKGRLAASGRRTVRVGGLGWQRAVQVKRDGWSAVGNGSTYVVSMRPRGGTWRPVYNATAVRARPTIDGRNVSIRPVDGDFEAVVTRGNRTLGSATVPTKGNETRVGGLVLNRTGKKLIAQRNRTRVQVAKKGS
jgi:membrane associated rhomboid family serine protease